MQEKGIPTDKLEEMHRFARSREARSRSRLSPVIFVLYRFRLLRPFLRWMIYRLEGGMMYSTSLRDILDRQYKVRVGKYTYGPILKPGFLPPGTVIGNYCSIGPNVKVFRRNHPVDRVSSHPFFYTKKGGVLSEDCVALAEDNPLHMGNDVWIGANTIILQNCRRIGDGAVIGAGAVVTKDVPPYTIVGGNPARPLKKRFPDEVEAVVAESGWFLRSLPDLLDSIDVFLNPASEDSVGRLLSVDPSDKESHVSSPATDTSNVRRANTVHP